MRISVLGQGRSNGLRIKGVSRTREVTPVRQQFPRDQLRGKTAMSGRWSSKETLGGFRQV